MQEKLIALKKEHDELRDEYESIYKDGFSREEQLLVHKMRPIETTFQQLGLNVFTYRPK